MKLLSLLLLLALPLAAQAQFTFTTNSGALSITGYTGPGGAVSIPAMTNGYPVTSIGENVFSGAGLTSVTIPKSVTGIGEATFSQCYSLTNINVVAGNPDFSSVHGVLFDQTQATLIAYPGGLGVDYTIPNSVTTIGDAAFTYCTKLTSVTIPNSVTTIGEVAFYGCTSLTNVAIPDSVTSIGMQTFSGCLGLTSMTIPNSTTSIGEYAFAGCANLMSVIIPDSVTSIGQYAFFDCPSLRSVTIPNSITSIGAGMFDECSSLTNVTIPNSVTNIGSVAFLECTSLKSVTIPKSVTGIGDFAFYECTSLTAAYFQGNAPPDDGTIFYYDSATVYYLAGTTGWGSTFEGMPAVLWNPQAQVPGLTIGQFGFGITGPTNATIVVEACTNLANPVWLPVATSTLNNSGSGVFTDPQTGSYPTRYYRFSSQ
jgi:hypothetical protein